jgi:rhomboid family GlyGly-CTERM serine protease
MGLHKLKVSTATTPAMTWLFPVVYIGISILVMMTGDLGKEVLRYDRVWIGQGEAWRLISGHFAHLGWSHLALNSVGLLLVWFLIGGAYTLRTWVLIVGVTFATMDLGFWFLNPELYWYVGMSGLLHGLLAAGIVARLRNIDAETTVLVLLLIAKISWEQFSGPVPGSESTSGGPVVVDAHLYGALGGILGAILARIRVGPPAPI